MTYKAYFRTVHSPRPKRLIYLPRTLNNTTEDSTTKDVTNLFRVKK